MATQIVQDGKLPPLWHYGHEEHDIIETKTFGFWLYMLSDALIFAGIFAAYAVLDHAMNAATARPRHRSVSPHRRLRADLGRAPQRARLQPCHRGAEAWQPPVADHGHARRDRARGAFSSGWSSAISPHSMPRVRPRKPADFSPPSSSSSPRMGAYGLWHPLDAGHAGAGLPLGFTAPVVAHAEPASVLAVPGAVWVLRLCVRLSEGGDLMSTHQPDPLQHPEVQQATRCRLYGRVSRHPGAAGRGTAADRAAHHAALGAAGQHLCAWPWSHCWRNVSCSSA